MESDSVEFMTFGGILYSVSPRDPLLRTIDPTDGSTLTERAIQLKGATVSGATGLASDPTTGELFALLKLQGQTGRELVIVDPSTGQATSVGDTGDRFAGLTIAADGTLYGVTGDGADQPATLFKLDRGNGTRTLPMPLNTQGGDGEAIASNPDDGLLYHASGLQPEELVFETIDPLLGTEAELGLSLSGLAGLPGPLNAPGKYEEATAMVYAGSHRFLVADLNVPPHSAQMFLVEVPHVAGAFGQVCQRGPRSEGSCTPDQEFPLLSTDCCTDPSDCSVDDPNHACSPPLIDICERGHRRGEVCEPDELFPPFSVDCCRDLVMCSFDDPNNTCSSTPVRTCIAGAVSRLCASHQGCDTFVCVAGDPNTRGEPCAIDLDCESPFSQGDCGSAADGVCDALADPALGICERGVRSGAPCAQDATFPPFSVDCCRDLVMCAFDDPNNRCSDPSPRTCEQGKIGRPCVANNGCDSFVCVAGDPNTVGEECTTDLDCQDPSGFFDGVCGSTGNGVCGQPAASVGILGDMDHTSKGLAFLPDSDLDSRPNITDNCPFEPNNADDDVQRDSNQNGRGDACECGNADKNTTVDIFDALHIARGTLSPPLVEMIHPRACDADGNGTCDIFDALRVAQGTLVPPLAEIVQECEAATVAPGGS